LEEEVTMFMGQFDLNKDGRVSWDEFCFVLEKIKAEMGTKAGNAREYTSYEKMKADRFKHVRVKLDL
jgi:hypothetical protein